MAIRPQQMTVMELFAGEHLAPGRGRELPALTNSARGAVVAIDALFADCRIRDDEDGVYFPNPLVAS